VGNLLKRRLDCLPSGKEKPRRSGVFQSIYFFFFLAVVFFFLAAAFFLAAMGYAPGSIGNKSLSPVLQTD
jgi:hypothetical protein